MGPELGCSCIVIGKPGSQGIGRLGSLAERTTPTWLASSFSADAWRSDSVFNGFLTAFNQGQFLHRMEPAAQAVSPKTGRKSAG